MDDVPDMGLLPFLDGRVGVILVALVELAPGCDFWGVLLWLLPPRHVVGVLAVFHVSAQRCYVLDSSPMIDSLHLRSVSVWSTRDARCEF